MTILEQIKKVLEGKEGTEITSSYIKEELKVRFGTNPRSVLISDYCYNRTNEGINFEKQPHLFKFKNRNEYVYLGEKHKYSGKIYHKPLNKKIRDFGEWVNGRLSIYPAEK